MKTATIPSFLLFATMSLSVGIAPSAHADRAENAFVTVRAVGADVERKGGCNFTASEDGEVEIEAQSGWILLTPSRVRVTKNQSPRYRVRSASNEDEGEGEVWRAVVEVSTNHLSNPVVAASVSAGGPYVYALPDDGADVAATFAASATKLGTHETETRTTTYRNGAVVDESVEMSAPFTLDIDRWSWDWIFEDSGTTNRQTFATPVQHLTNGTYTATGTVEGHSSRCAACSATAAASTNIVVSLLSVSCDPWIGQDRTGDPSAPYESPKVTATASLEPENPDVKKVTWGGDSKCERGITNDWSLTLWTENRDLASDTYLGEEVTASVAGATATTNFTIVKVDVILDELPEEEEEEAGAASWVCDTEEEVSAGDKTRFTFICYPAIPDFNTITMEASHPEDLQNDPEKTLFLRKRTVPTSYTESGYVIPRTPSSLARDRSISASHPASGARDKANYAALRWVLKATAAIPEQQERLTFGVGENINAKVVPSGMVQEWALSTNCRYKEDGTDSSFDFSATDKTGSAFVEARIGNRWARKSFTIIPPDTYVSATIKLRKKFPAGVYGTGMLLSPVVIGPTHVSFANVYMAEKFQETSAIRGYFEHMPRAWISHLSAGHFVKLGPNNEFEDVAMMKPTNSVDGVTWREFEDSGYNWVIPTQWSLQKNGNPRHETGKKWLQEFFLDQEGTATIKKFGCSVSRRITEEDGPDEP